MEFGISTKISCCKGILMQKLQICPFSCPSLVYLADMYGIYKSNEPLLIKKTSFEVKHCKIENVFILRSAQAGKLKKTYI